MEISLKIMDKVTPFDDQLSCCKTSKQRFLLICISRLDNKEIN